MAYDFRDVMIKSPLAVPENNRMLVFVLQDSGRLNANLVNEAAEQEEEEVIAERVSYFTAARDLDNNYYILQVDPENSFQLLKGKPGQWEEKVYFKEEKGKGIGGLQILNGYKNQTHLIYLLFAANGKQWWLIHHRYVEDKWDEPRIIDFGGGENFNCYHAVIDNWDRVQLVYSIKEGSRTPLYLRTFSAPEMNWSRAVMLESEQNNLYPFLQEGPDYSLHLVWSSINQSNGWHINYRRKTPGGWPAGKWSPSVKLSNAYEEPIFPSLAWEEGRLTASWYTAGRMLTYAFLREDLKWERGEEIALDGEVAVQRIICPTEYSSLPRLHYWPGKNNVPLISKITGQSFVQPEEETGLYPFLSKLQEDSGNLFSQVTDLQRSRFELQHQLEGKKQEVRWLSYQSRQYLANLQNDLLNKEQEIKQMEEKFNLTLASLKQKAQQSRRAWDEENMKLIKQNTQLKKEESELQKKLKNKETELELKQQQIESLKKISEELLAENMTLKESLAQKGFSFREFFNRLTHNKPS